MNSNLEQTENLITQLEGIKDYACRLEKRFSEELMSVHPEMKKSAANLLHYIALRRTDISSLQRKLGELGVSRLAKTEGHVMAGLNSVLQILNLIRGKEIKTEGEFISFSEGDHLLEKNSESLLGKVPEKRRVRIMVTLPDEAADDYSIIENLLKAGMDCARINCAHGDPAFWTKIAENIKRGNRELNKNCLLNMDLSGPKLRTGSMTPGPQVLHIQPERNELGKIINPAYLILTPENQLNSSSAVPQIPLTEGFIKHVQKGDKLTLFDARGKDIVIKITGKDGSSLLAQCSESAYLITGTKINLTKKKKSYSAKVGFIRPLEGSIKLRKGDKLILHKEDIPGEPAVYDESGKIISPAHISCTLPEVFEDVRAGEPILLR
jgi:pyruvate kinase